MLSTLLRSPLEGGEIPDCAGMIAAVEAVTDTRVEAVMGKPVADHPGGGAGIPWRTPAPRR
jgi:hypothetical protein